MVSYKDVLWTLPFPSWRPVCSLVLAREDIGPPVISLSLDVCFAASDILLVLADIGGGISSSCTLASIGGGISSSCTLAGIIVTLGIDGSISS